MPLAYNPVFSIANYPGYNPAGEGGVPSLLLLDLYPGAAAAYSLTRKLRTAYAGSAFRVRRSSDNAERDIGFVGNDVDTASLLSFCGAGNGFISKVYDQSGNGYDAIQATAGNQFRIVSSGSLDVLSLTSILSMYSATQGPIYSVNAAIQARSVFAVGDVTGTGDSNVMFLGSNDASHGGLGPYYYKFNEAGTCVADAYYADYADWIARGDATSLNTPYVYTSIKKATTIDVQINDGAITTSDALVQTQKTAAANMVIGGIYFSGNYYGAHIGHLSEIIIYATDQSSNRSAINQNLKDYYGI